MSSACVDYVPALCTHRPSLLPIERLSEAFGLAQTVGNDDQSRKVGQTWSFRGSKSRNKVSRWNMILLWAFIEAFAARESMPSRLLK
jgi:hypothetical protein